MTHNIEEEKRKYAERRKAANVVAPEPVEARIEHAQKINHELASRTASTQAESESRRKYHAAWQEYYQKYYEHYYLAQLELQKRDVTRGRAEPKALSPRQQEIDNLRKDLLKKISNNADKVKKSRHFKPILAGVIVVVLAVFVQYNQLFSAGLHSFVSPSENQASLIIADGTGQPVNSSPTVLIPKISVKAPIVFDLNTLTEAASQSALEQGVINFPVAGASAKPGQNGNTVILGHSSSDIFNSGQYKFIFVQLNNLVAGDLFYIDYNATRYTYEVINKKIVEANELGQLYLGDKSPYATLVTCDPPGTAFNRLLVIGQQISPNPQTATTEQNTTVQREDIPGNPPTLFERLFN